MSKYNSKKTEEGGILFDSKKEARRWRELQLWEKAGGIRNLQRQVRFTLTRARRWRDGKWHRERSYVADFVYEDAYSGEVIVEDVKGFRTEAYKLKRELMKELYDIEIKEV